MPRLGGGNSPSRRRGGGPANPVQQFLGTSRWIKLRNVLLFMTAFFVMRNLLRRDYRQEEIQYLRDSGMSQDQIHRYIPRTSEEQRKYAQDKSNDGEKMKKDIAYLLNEVAELKMQSMTAQQNQSGEHSQHQHHPHQDQPQHEDGNERENALKTMDQVHAQKRQQQEDELLKENPNFHSSKRVKDMTKEEVQRALQK